MNRKGTRDNINSKEFSPEEKPLKNLSSEKTYSYRNSLLIELKSNNPHIRTLHHLFIVSLICLLLSTAFDDFIKKGYTTLGFHLILLTFSNVHVAILYWLWAFTMSFVAYYFFSLWAKIRTTYFFPKSVGVKLLDFASLNLLVAYYAASFITAEKVVVMFQLPAASSALVVIEQVRFLMKVHAFVRTKVPMVLNYKKNDENSPVILSFSKFFYFLFAPTLVYKDDYPRTSQTDWKFVFYRLLEVIGVICYQSLLFYKFILPVYEDFGKRPYSKLEIFRGIFEVSLPSLLNHVLGFYMILHSVQNLFAEILRFADRQFYREWWISTNMSEYFRDWNIIVHEWLYVYVYKDFYDFIVANKTMAKTAVFVVSAVVHEWCLSYIVGYFFPLLFISFFFFGGCTSMFVKVPNAAFLNVLFWYTLAFGNGTIYGLYTLEYYARVNVPLVNPTFIDYILPRFITSGFIK